MQRGKNASEAIALPRGPEPLLGAPQTSRLLAEFGNCFTAGKNESKERKKEKERRA